VHASLRPVQKLLRGPLGPLAARLSSKTMFGREFARLFSAEHPLSAEEADAQWALMSYNGGVYYGLTADRDAMSDVDVLSSLIESSLAELVDTVR